MGFPFLAYYGVITNNQTLIQIAVDNCRFYHDALIRPDSPHGPAWGHLFAEYRNEWWDINIWLTGVLPPPVRASVRKALICDLSHLPLTS
jgi:hypothetical protein